MDIMIRSRGPAGKRETAFRSDDEPRAVRTTALRKSRGGYTFPTRRPSSARRSLKISLGKIDDANPTRRIEQTRRNNDRSPEISHVTAAAADTRACHVTVRANQKHSFIRNH